MGILGAHEKYRTCFARGFVDRKNGCLVGKIVTLRPLDKSYFQDYMSMFSETVKKFLHVKHDESEIKYLETRLENKGFFYCIFLNTENKLSENKLENKLIGAIEIRDLTESDGQLYSWVNENYWGSGAYQEALTLISKKYFEICDAGIKNTGVCSTEICDTGTCGVCDKSVGSRTNATARCKYYTANVDAENLRSYYALKKFGFIDAGVKNGPYGLQYRLILLSPAKK